MAVPVCVRNYESSGCGVCGVDGGKGVGEKDLRVGCVQVEEVNEFCVRVVLYVLNEGSVRWKAVPVLRQLKRWAVGRT